MNFETLENVRLFVSATTYKLKVSANNAHLNGYHEVAREHENEAALGDQILKALAQEKTNA